MRAENLEFFIKILQVDSTTGKEREMAVMLADATATDKNRVELLEVGDGSVNLRVSWGNPKVWMCTHCDTVPPYISPQVDGDRVKGRGSCDAKGQIISMWLAAKELEKEGVKDFGLLILAGEETGSFGAKAYDRDYEGGYAVIVGEPTDNKMVKASKGTCSFAVTIKGIPCHSGYPELGESAVLKFVDFVEKLKGYKFPVDDILGETTWNIGDLRSDNPQNILSGEVTFRLYFRTTFATAGLVDAIVKSLLPEGSVCENRGGDIPMKYTVFEDYETTTVAFGSDAPRLSKFEKRILCGPGNINVAHTAKEYVDLKDIEKAVSQYVEFVKKLLKNK